MGLRRNNKGDQMTILVFNLPGIFMVAMAWGLAFGFGALVGTRSEAPLTIFAGVLILMLDMVYRLLRKEGHWIVPSRGGSLFYLPAWGFGILWITLGIVYALSGDAATSSVAAP